MQSNPEKAGRRQMPLAVIWRLTVFSLPQTALCSRHKLNWRKLLVSVFKLVRQDGCPEGPSGPFGEVFEGE